ncbi:MAG: tetratricopeptide repeat protein [Flavobacteriales bacterium]|jgi:tetratricopeptide (TPR) repeat protein|nr:tetratricopeptide repeat protein [Flavobacteriales bacterium]
MIKKALIFTSVALLGVFVACSGSSDQDIVVEKNEEVKDTIVDTLEERIALIDNYSLILANDTTGVHREVAEKLLLAYEDFLKHHSFETISKEYQFRAGELAKAINKPHLAIKHLNGLLERDPDHERAPLALFYKATIVGDMLNEDENAKMLYQEFIDKYPDHPLAESAKESIKLQGKSLDEIVKEFEKKNKS